jgi:hypothetical protein
MNKTGFLLAVCAAVCLTAAAMAQDANLIANRLSFARVGEWASYTLPGGYVQKLIVIGRSEPGPEGLVTIRIENLYDGQLVEAREIVEKAGEPFAAPNVPVDPGVFVAVRNDIAALKDRDVVAGVVEINKALGTEDQDVTEWWTSADVPVFGIIKKVENGENAWELVDWQEAPESFSDKAAAAMQAAGETAVKAKDVVAEKASAAGQAISGAASSAKETISEKASSMLKAIDAKIHGDEVPPEN